MQKPPSTRILVIRRDNIGDMICTTPFLLALRTNMPEAHISVLANSYNHAVLTGNPNIDEIYSYDKLKHKNSVWKKIAAAIARVQLLIKLRKANIDLAILAKPSFDRHGLRMARWAGAKRILGFIQNQNDTAQGITDPVVPQNIFTKSKPLDNSYSHWGLKRHLKN